MIMSYLLDKRIKKEYTNLRISCILTLRRIYMKEFFKKFMASFAALALVAGLSACSGGRDNENSGLKVLCTVFPVYDWAREISGDKADVSLLVSGGTDMHSYQPSAEDMIEIAGCDILIYVGGVSDGWIDEAVKQQENKERTVINLLEVLGDKAVSEELSDGMQAEEHAHEDGGEEYDEHVWLSLKNAELFVRAISEALSEKNPDQADYFSGRAEAYIGELNELDEEYSETAESAEKKTLVFADRFPFRYLTEDYGLSYYAAFPGCSAETDASFETIAFLSGKIDELGIKYVLTTESPVPGIAETVAENTKEKNQQILALDSMQSVIDGSADYLEIMRNNLETLKKAIS